MHAPGREPLGGLTGLDEDLSTLLEASSGVQSRAPGSTPRRREVAARARLEAFVRVEELAPGLLFPYALQANLAAFRLRVARAIENVEPKWSEALEAAFPKRNAFPHDVAFSFPPPRGPALFPLPSGTTPRNVGAFLSGFGSTPWGESLVAALCLDPAYAAAVLRSVGVFEHAAFARHASFSDESGRESLVFTHRHVSDDWRTWSLWAHEAGHVLHATALICEGRSPTLCPAWRKETAGLASELLFLAGCGWDTLAARLATGDAGAHGVLSFWWRESLQGGDPAYVPAAWNVWNALQDRGPLPCSRSDSPALA